MIDQHYLQILKSIAEELEASNITYQFTDETALFLQGVDVNPNKKIYALIQWDQFDTLYAKFADENPTLLIKDVSKASFQVQREGLTIHFTCLYNITIKTDPYRIQVKVNDSIYWCQSLYTYLYYKKNELTDTIHYSLLKKQNEITKQNESAWNQDNYQALINRYGSPREAAEKIRHNPMWRLHPFYKFMDNISGKKIIHLLGSNGIKGVAMAMLGADVTIVDFSKENQRYANEVASEAGINIEYIVSDVLALTNDKNGMFDMVLMELGVMHYFIDLTPLAKKIYELLKVNGSFILHEFHPVSTKLITSSGKKHKVTGNYFDPSIKSADVAFSKHVEAENQQNLAKVLQRQWTLGEVVTAFAKEGLYVELLEEEPNHKLHDIGLPKTYTICAKKL